MTYLAVPGRVARVGNGRKVLVEVFDDCDHFPQWEVTLIAPALGGHDLPDDQVVRALWKVGLDQLRAEIALGGDPPEEIQVDAARFEAELQNGSLPSVGEVSWSTSREWVPLRSEQDYQQWRKWFYSNTPAGTRIHLGPPEKYPCRATVVEGGPFGQNRIFTAVYAPG